VTGFRVRIYVGGQVADESWCPPEDAEEVAQRQRRIADWADLNGYRWVVEVHDPDEPEGGVAYPLRFGTDPSGMGLPLKMGERVIDLPEPPMHTSN
jgi:hypothetical protein